MKNSLQFFVCRKLSLILISVLYHQNRTLRIPAYKKGGFVLQRYALKFMPRQVGTQKADRYTLNCLFVAGGTFHFYEAEFFTRKDNNLGQTELLSNLSLRLGTHVYFVNKNHSDRWLRCDPKTKPCNFSFNWPTPGDFNCKFFSCLGVTVFLKVVVEVVQFIRLDKSKIKRLNRPRTRFLRSPQKFPQRNRNSRRDIIYFHPHQVNR